MAEPTMPLKPRPRHPRTPLALAALCFLVSTAAASWCWREAEKVGFIAEGFDRKGPGWEYLLQAEWVDAPGNILVALPRALVFTPGSAAWEVLADMKRGYFLSRFLWPAIGYVLGWLLIAFRCSVYGCAELMADSPSDGQ